MLQLGMNTGLIVRGLIFSSILSSYLCRPVVPEDGAFKDRERDYNNTAATTANQLHSSCSDSVPKLTHHQSWKSTRTKCLTDITIVTHLASNQLVGLGHMCTSWKGWISAAIHIAPEVEEASLISALALWHADLEKVDACALDLSVYSSSDTDGAVTPNNALRNRALTMSTTELVLPLDVSFLVSNTLTVPEHNQQLLEMASAGAAIVVTAWEPAAAGDAGQQAAVDFISGPKSGVVQACKTGALTLFEGKTSPVKQYASNVGMWLHSTALYGAHYTKGYEPFVVVSKRLVPWFDERIQDSQMGRQLHLEHMHASGLGFVVHPHAFIVKQPVLDSLPHILTKQMLQADEHLAAEIQRQMSEKTYLPASLYAPCSDPFQSPLTVNTLTTESCSAKPQDKPMLSPLWGTHGELFSEAGNLRDWSRAGYAAGERPVPSPDSFSDLVVDWNAAGDGLTDDTQALTIAIQKSPAGSALYLPPGRFRITEMINITKSVILRGAGPSQTTLYFPFSLADVYGNSLDATTGYSQWAFRPGFLNFLGSDPIGPYTTLLAPVTKSATKGTHELTLGIWVHGGSAPAVGSWVRLTQSDPSPVTAAPITGTVGADAQPGSLIEHLYGGWDVLSADALPHVYAGELQGTQYAAQLIARVLGFSNGVLRLDRALPFDVQPEWNPEIHVVQPSLKEAGIENLSIEFAEAAYDGHFREAGYNALYISAAHDCWVKDVHIINADYAIGLNGTHFCTLDNINMYDSTDRRGGHHGIDISYGADNLITNFSFGKEFLHDLSIEWYTQGNVISDGVGVDLNLDHHRGAPSGNLFTNLHLGKGTRPFASSGAHGRGAHSGAYNMYWNLLSENCWDLPSSDFGHSLIFAGAHAALPCINDPEPAQKLMLPANLHAAMKVRHGLQSEMSI